MFGYEYNKTESNKRTMNKDYMIRRMRYNDWQVVYLGKQICAAKVVDDKVVCHVGYVSRVYNLIFGREKK